MTHRLSWTAAAAIVGLLAAAPSNACDGTVLVPPQVQVRHAAIVVEGLATDAQFRFDVQRTWKGRAYAAVRTIGIRPDGSSCDPYQPTVPGARYLILIGADDPVMDGTLAVFAGKAKAVRMEHASPLLDYLLRPVRVSRMDILTMLRGWRDGTVQDQKIAKWLQDVTPVAEVDDWARYPSGDEPAEEVSLNLYLLRELQSRINNGPLEDLSCELRVIHERVVPAMIRILEARRLTPDMLENVPELDDYIEQTICP